MRLKKLNMLKKSVKLNTSKIQCLEYLKQTSKHFFKFIELNATPLVQLSSMLKKNVVTNMSKHVKQDGKLLVGQRFGFLILVNVKTW